MTLNFAKVAAERLPSSCARNSIAEVTQNAGD
jgi:hypothetical protein